LHLFQWQHLLDSQLPFPEILLTLPLGTMEISDSISEEPAATVQMMYASTWPLSETTTQEYSGGNPFPAHNLIAIALTWD
jgi:hypothetical protein